MASDSQTTKTSQPRPVIDNRMKDYGNGRHVGWWTEEDVGLSALLIEVDRSVIISCCEGAHAEKRITFVTSREKATEIVRAAAIALGLEIA